MKRSPSKKAAISRKTAGPLFAGWLLVLAAGCGNHGKGPTANQQIRILREQNSQLKRQIELSAREKEQLQEKVHVLSGLPDDVKGEKLYQLQRVKITRYTNLYDKDKDGRYDKLIIYIQPIDGQGDVIKAGGAVDVQLWDLNEQAGQALLAQWHVTDTELKKLWYATLLTINYRLTFDVAAIIEKFDKPLTVKVAFTDYLSGQVFDEQRAIEPAY